MTNQELQAIRNKVNQAQAGPWWQTDVPLLLDEILELRSRFRGIHDHMGEKFTTCFLCLGTLPNHGLDCPVHPNKFAV